MSIKKNPLMELYAGYIKETVKDQESLDEVAKQGSERYGDNVIHKVIHNDGKGNHLTMTYPESEGGAVTYHGRVHGHKIRIDAEGKHGGDPSKRDVTSAVKKAKLPPETHALVLKHAHAGMENLVNETYERAVSLKETWNSLD